MSITFKELEKKIKSKEIDTVLVSLSDMQGRLVGKRVTGKAFLDYVHKETHFCDYLYTVDMDMYTVPGFKSSSWETGYGDMTVKPDQRTIKVLPWLDKTALVLGDAFQHDGKTPVSHSTRQVLREAIIKANKMGFEPMLGSELEFFLFKQTYEDIHSSYYKNLKETSWYIEDYMIFQTSKEEPFNQELRNSLLDSGIYVECTKGEASPGQQEINVVFTDALSMADNHILIKNAAKEIAFKHNRAVSFMAKYKQDFCGSSCHIHNSLFDKKTKKVEWFRTRGRAIWDEKGNAIRFNGLVENINSRKLMEQKLQEVEQRMQDAINSMPHGITWWDKNDKSSKLCLKIPLSIE